MPFGEEVGAGVGGRTTSQGYVVDSVAQKFTGKIRDGESGLDYFDARYYANPQGRFTSPDPLLSSGKPLHPLSWNRYTYCLNNPLILVDPSGLMWIYQDRKHNERAWSWVDGNKAPEGWKQWTGSSTVKLPNGNVLELGDKGHFTLSHNAFRDFKTGNTGDSQGRVNIAAALVNQVPLIGHATTSLLGAGGHTDSPEYQNASLGLGIAFQGGLLFTGESEVEAVGSLAEEAEETTTLYRAVGHEEFEQIMRTKTFEAGTNSLGGKWLAESAEHAEQWGQKLEGEGGFRIVDTKIPTVQADKFMRVERLDGIGPARYAELNQLKNAVIGTVK